MTELAKLKDKWREGAIRFDEAEHFINMLINENERLECAPERDKVYVEIPLDASEERLALLGDALERGMVTHEAPSEEGLSSFSLGNGDTLNIKGSPLAHRIVGKILDDRAAAFELLQEIYGTVFAAAKVPEFLKERKFK